MRTVLDAGQAAVQPLFGSEPSPANETCFHIVANCSPLNCPFVKFHHIAILWGNAEISPLIHQLFSFFEQC